MSRNGECVVNDESVFLLSEGTPFRVNVDAADGQYVSAYGPGLVQGGCGEKLHFFIAKSGSARETFS